MGGGINLLLSGLPSGFFNRATRLITTASDRSVPSGSITVGARSGGFRMARG